MTANRDWTYYRLDPLTGRPPGYYRRWRGVTELLNVRDLVWVKGNGEMILRYIENGEIDLGESTRSAMETALGVTTPKLAKHLQIRRTIPTPV
jgi:hypothetical protein